MNIDSLWGTLKSHEIEMFLCLENDAKQCCNFTTLNCTYCCQLLKQWVQFTMKTVLIIHCNAKPENEPVRHTPKIL